MGGQVERGEPVARLHEVPYECRARWRHSAGAAWAIAYIRVGVLEDGTGRWFVDVAGPDAGTTGWPDKQAAWREVRRLMALYGDEWKRVPCYPTQEQS